MSTQDGARPHSRLRRVAVACGVVLALSAPAVGYEAASAGHHANPDVVAGSTLNVYSSLPEQGPLSGTMRSIVQGEQLALAQAQGRAGNFTVNLVPLDDSTRALGNYDAGQCASDAAVAAADPHAIGYIGDYNSGCSEEVIPTLNRAGIAQISPGNTYVGLTTNLPGSAPGEPGKYYPTGTDTYFRTVPTDAVQAGALLQAVKDAGLTSVVVADDGTAYGAGLARQIQLDAQSYGVTVVNITQVNPYAPDYTAYAAGVKASGAQGFVFAGTPATGGNRITEDVHAANPKMRMFFPDGMASSAFTDPAEGGVPTALDPLIEVTTPTLAPTAYPGGEAFVQAYRAAYGDAQPDPAAIQGYSAMQVFLKAIGGLGTNGNSRSAVVNALHSGSFTTALGVVRFNRHGDTSVRDFGLDGVRDGQLVPKATLTPQQVLGS